MLAVVSADGNIVLYDEHGQHPQPLTMDAAAGMRLYQWPTWSTDGRLAFFGACADPVNPYSLGVFIARHPDRGGYETAYESLDEVFTYAYWSPSDCGPGNCRVLALLLTPPGGKSLALRMIRDDRIGVSTHIAGRAAPFYFCFSVDSTRMLWHRLGSRLELYDVENNDIHDTLSDVPGHFAAPMWSPVSNDDRMLFGVQGNEVTRTDLVIAQGQQRQMLVEGLDGTVAFSWSPDATKIAYAGGAGKLTVIDATGMLLAAPKIGNVIAHFWSPNGDKVAFLTLNRDVPGIQTRYRPNGRTATAGLQAPTLTWFILNVGTGEAVPLTDFFPTRDMIYYLNFADQFSRSHSLWSPDGRYLVYGSASDGTDRVVLLDVNADRAGTTINVAAGALGVWSWR